MGNCFSGDDTSPPPPPQPPPEGGNASPVMDPRLVSLLDFSRQLYLRSNELFSHVIPLHGDEIAELFRKIGKAEERIGGGLQARLKRSHSAGAMLAVARGVDLVDSGGDLKDHRFKVKTLDVGEAPPPAGQGGGGTKAGGGAK